MAGVNLRRGLWRLAFVLWALPMLGLVPLAVISSPFLMVGPDDRSEFECESERSFGDRYVDEQFPSLRRDSEALDRDCETLRAKWQAARVPRYRTERFREGLQNVLAIALGWTAAVWGVFYLGDWIARGFRS